MEKNLTTGSVFKNLISFSLPYLLSYFLQTLYGMADLFIIGQFEDVACITAVSIGSQFMHMLTIVIVGLAMGATVTIGQAVGAGDKRGVSSCIGNTAVLFMVLSGVLTVLLLMLVRPIVSVMSTPSEAVSGTVSYLTICFIGIPLITAYNIISSVYRGMGDSKSPMFFVAIACVLNIILDYLFIGALHMGPSGAALATTLSQAASVACALFMSRAVRSGPLVSRKDFTPQFDVMHRILRIGIPVACQDGLLQLAFIIITVIANSRGLNDAAAVGIVEKVISFIFLVPSSMLSAVSAIGAQNVGAGEHERAVATLRYAIFISVCFGLFVSVLMQFLSEQVVALFTDASASGGAEVIRLGGEYMRGYIWDTALAGIHFSFSGYFCAIGRSEISFIHNIASVSLVRVPGVYAASKLFADTLLPMGLATTSGSFVSVIFCFIVFHVLEKRRKAGTQSV